LEGLLPLLVQLVLLDAGGASVNAGKALSSFLNKLQDTPRVQGVVNQLLLAGGGLHSATTSTSLDCLIWLSKAIWQRGAPPQAMQALLHRLIGIIAQVERAAQ